MSSTECQPAKLRSAFREYTRNFLIATALYAIVLWASVSAIVAHRAGAVEVPDWAVVLIALAPVAPVLLMLHVYLTMFRKLDELQRRIQSEAILISAGIVGFGSFAYGFLEGAAGFPSIPGALIWILPAMIAVWGLALPFVSRRYR